MTILSLCRNSCNGALDRCHRIFPCFADPVKRSSLGLKVALVMLHLIYAGILFLFDNDLIEKAKQDPWYIALYLLLFVATLVQYFVTACSSPGYVLDAMRALNEKNGVFGKASMTSKQPASSKNGSFVITVEGTQSGRNTPGSNLTSWTKLVLDMYPPGTSIRTFTCTYCNVEQVLWTDLARLHALSIAMIVTNVFFSLIITVFGLEHALVREIIVDFGEFVF
ncbi:hypothetical protein JCGZ_23761 [Jatropha curcas]|uniref:S-acyltransferase n=1 Tax=Jatropha curcas TaxID=180498 RepID=A0A067LFF2_JATCU|nr:hypothetical protein JCGZ_23761 [Jatropha curcas]